jgi:hypothetical protein
MVRPGAAQEESLSVDVAECVDLATPEQRLACFEAQVEAARNAPPAASSPAPTASSPPPAGQDAESKDAAAPPDIVAKVAELRETVPNAYLITLDNGQVWRQTRPEYYPLRTGSEVRIWYSRWRTFRLTDPKLRGYIQVERVR